MIFFIILTSVFFILYITTSIIFTGIKRYGGKQYFVKSPAVSIIIAIRNEAANLPECLKSLSQLDYPQDTLEIIIVDDNSTDHSRQIIESYTKKYNSFKYLFLGRDKKQRPGKAGALLHGINNSRGEFIFITDADCRVPTSWIKGTLKLFKKNTGLVGGFTLVDSGSFLSKIEAFDLFFLLSVASSAAQLNKPCSWIGNNMAFRRQVYEESGGYSEHGFSLIEDQALVDAIAKGTRWRILLLPDRENAIRSLPAPNGFQLINQRKRWLLGLRTIRPLGRFLVLVSGFTRILTPLLFFVFPVVVAAVILTIVFLCDFFIIFLPARKVEYKFDWRYFIGFELMQILLAYILPLFYMLSNRISWKEYKYKVNKFEPDSILNE